MSVRGGREEENLQVMFLGLDGTSDEKEARIRLLASNKDQYERLCGMECMEGDGEEQDEHSRGG